jgi:hypothetical protein
MGTPSFFGVGEGMRGLVCPHSGKTGRMGLRGEEALVADKSPYEGPCIMCEEKATWIRHTQFAGSHPYCLEHAEKEDDFKKTDSSCFFWEMLKLNGN